MTSFTPDPVNQDFSTVYTDSGVADPTPEDSFYESIKSATAASASYATAPTGKPVPATTPTPAPTTSPAPSAAPKTSTPNPSSTTISPEATALLERLKPMGITSLDGLKKKTDVELRKLSTDVLSYENRQKALNSYFFKNPDGSFDMTRSPDGSLTGLDASGKVVSAGKPATPAPGTTAKPPTPAPKPGSTPKKPAPKPKAAPKPKKKAAPKPKKAVTHRKPTTKAPRRPAPKPRKTAVKPKPATHAVGTGALR